MTEPSAEIKKIYRSQADRLVAGVCGGIAEYFSLSSALVRVLLIIFSLISGVGLLFYVVCWFILPKNPDEQPAAKTPRRSDHSAELTVGLILLVFGLLFFIKAMGWHWNFLWPFWHLTFLRWSTLMPLFLILLGLWMVVRALRETEKTDDKHPGAAAVSSINLLQRNRTDRMVGGVLGGLAANWRVDSSFLRIGTVFLTLATHWLLGIAVYFALWILLPEEAEKSKSIELPAVKPRQRRRTTRKPELPPDQR